MIYIQLNSVREKDLDISSWGWTLTLSCWQAHVPICCLWQLLKDSLTSKKFSNRTPPLSFLVQEKYHLIVGYKQVYVISPRSLELHLYHYSSGNCIGFNVSLITCTRFVRHKTWAAGEPHYKVDYLTLNNLSEFLHILRIKRKINWRCIEKERSSSSYLSIASVSFCYVSEP